MIKSTNYRLLIAGSLLSLMGLILGGFIPLFTNPRLALSAHEQGIIAGAFLMLLGLVWPYAVFGKIKSETTSVLLIFGTYLIWIGTLLGSILGTSRATPIAGAGFSGTIGQEITVSIVLMAGSVMTIFGMLIVTISLIRKTRNS
jgi:hydroxylaminobenzene mutase